MKKICTILLVCLTTLSYAQNLSFSRVIDTVITLNIGATQQNLSTKFLGQTLSPPAGTVWKVNNILLDPGEVVEPQTGGYNCFFCNDPNQNRSDIYFGIDIYDGANDIDIELRRPDIASYTVHNAGYTTPLSYPLWINPNSLIRTFMIQQSETTSNPDICVKNVFAKAYLSIIEFKTQ